MQNKPAKTASRGFFGTTNPNAVPFVYPDKIGDVYVRTDTIQLFFSVCLTPTGVSSTSSAIWGTCGTAGA
jgi:hypothetical protein